MNDRGFELIEYENRLERVQEIMHLYKFDALLLTSQYFMRYFTGFSSQFWESPTRPWYLIIPNIGLPKVVIPEIGTVAMQKTWIKEIYTWPSPRPEDEGISIVLDLIKKIPSKFDNIGAELGHEMALRMPIIDFFSLKSKLPINIIDAAQILWQLRMIKSSSEINKIKNICKIASDTYQNLPSIVNIGNTERDVSSKISIDLISRGVDTIPFLPVVSGENGISQIINEPTDRSLKIGDILFLDTGSTYDGYFCDFNRNYSIGKASNQINNAYELLWIATQSAIELAKPGLPISELWKIMYDKLNKFMPKKYYSGRFGHGFGLQLTEPPSITFDNNMRLVPKMVLTIEPSIEYIPGKILVHEENIVITDSGAKLLTNRAPYKIPEILS